MVILRLSRRSIRALASIGYLTSDRSETLARSFFGLDLAFDQLNGADKISQYLTNHCSFARCLKMRLHTHLGAPDDLVRHI